MLQFDLDQILKKYLKQTYEECRTNIKPSISPRQLTNILHEIMELENIELIRLKNKKECSHIHYTGIGNYYQCIDCNYKWISGK